jgi:hypothetical protein
MSVNGMSVSLASYRSNLFEHFSDGVLHSSSRPMAWTSRMAQPSQTTKAYDFEPLIAL